MIASLKNFKPSKMSDITDEVVVSRMDDKMMKKVGNYGNRFGLMLMWYKD